MVQPSPEALDGNGPISPIGWLGEYGVKRLIQNKEFQAIERDGKALQEFAEETMKKTQEKLIESMAQALHASNEGVIDTELNPYDGAEGVLVRELITVLNLAKEDDSELQLTIRVSEKDKRVKEIWNRRRLLRSSTITDSSQRTWGLVLQSNGLYDSSEIPTDVFGHPYNAREKLVLIVLNPSKADYEPQISTDGRPHQEEMPAKV